MNKIYIELSSRQIFLKKDGETLSVYPVAIGKPSTPTPTGNFNIINKIVNPGNGLGTRWMQFTPQMHGIHGTNKPWLIGQAVSHGCVRMYNQDVEKLYDRVTVGTPVIIKHTLNQRTGSNYNNSNNRSNNDRSASNNNSSYNNSSSYIVKRGDSLWSIARNFNISVDDLKRINNIQGNTIYPGQVLKIPQKTYQAK